MHPTEGETVSLTDAERRQIHAAFEQALGAQVADLMMEKVLPPVEWSELAREASVAARFDKVDARFDKIDARFDKVDAEVIAVRGEMRRLAAMGFVHAVTASMATAGLVLAATKL
jgi:hypothetical protein